MKLKENVKVYLDPENLEFIITSEIKKMGKITGHALPNLLGYDNFSSVGKTILDRLGLTEFEPIDPIYTLRGELSEQLALDYITNMYKKFGVEIETKTFPSRYKGSNGVWYGNDLFKKNERFGGVIDIGIVAPQQFRAVIEVKSKTFYSEKGFNVFDSIFPHEKESNLPKSELWQGLHYASLMNIDKLIMTYVFWNNEQMEMLRPILNQPNFDINEINAKEVLKALNFDYTQFTIIPENVKVDLDDVREKQEQAYKTLEKVFKTKRIPFSAFRMSEAQELSELIYGKS